MYRFWGRNGINIERQNVVEARNFTDGDVAILCNSSDYLIMIKNAIIIYLVYLLAQNYGYDLSYVDQFISKALDIVNQAKAML